MIIAYGIQALCDLASFLSSITTPFISAVLNNLELPKRTMFFLASLPLNICFSSSSSIALPPLPFHLITCVYARRRNSSVTYFGNEPGFPNRIREKCFTSVVLCFIQFFTMALTWGGGELVALCMVITLNWRAEEMMLSLLWGFQLLT
jgi:hypothetical protein